MTKTKKQKTTTVATVKPHNVRLIKIGAIV